MTLTLPPLPYAVGGPLRASPCRLTTAAQEVALRMVADEQCQFNAR